ncbi:3-deoxy-D-manno-octulosonic acid transferase [Myroides marinus]|uniref:3-deoxy-D-manno-octulosonic acid transferase n=1 Tax=Myroides marinus TaxID=703342 RepID=UPI0025781490|nr:glycosyltransferase N-terminal domain-containing protein [Myroides marinus]MDM1367284.1 3-deoxy-D-manno-octulosonic acid transferase [Myroides marinus]MDM1374513.1 3-deoxy-D-manno-octulosonic acid transferase [Myroides marinus]MDM1381667.1 3-deoxy-D-manno-octulosonic acid transferase [Myroides marinus]
MFILYNLLTYISILFIKIIALFNKKLGLFVAGRKQSFQILKDNISPSDKVFWIHVASLGEFEQGLPVMEQLKKKFPTHKIVLTFFSPSGYEVKKNNTIADATLYLPMDTISNAKKFLELCHPEKAFFVKYEYWPNYLNQLRHQNIPTYLVSGILRPNQVFFKWYGGFYRKALKAFSYFFVQNEVSKTLLNSLHYNNVEIVGDTRFDRVSQILENNNDLSFLNDFTLGKTTKTIVIGSSWPEDERLLSTYINSITDKNTKFIFAPHNIKKDQIDNLLQSLKVPTILHSEHEGKDLSQYTVYIIDAYSILTKAYSYADIAYIGGGFGAGIHNILEAATYGVPVIIGPNYKKFQEAKDLITLGSCIVVNSQSDLDQIFDDLLQNKDKRVELGKTSNNFILKNKNATEKIMKHIE